MSPAALTASDHQRVAALRGILRDPAEYAARLLRIRTKSGDLIPLRYNAPQRKLHAIVERQRAAGKPVRIIVLKARQEGVSTYVQGRGFWMSATRRGCRGLVVAHDSDASDNLFRMARRYYDNLPSVVEIAPGAEAQIKPETRYSNRKELAFADLDSSIEVDTAETTDVGRSGTYQWAHCSEVAFWRDPEATMLSILQAIPDHPDTMVVLESTANGVGGYFYDQWHRAVEGRSGFVPVFLAWWEMAEYRAPVPPEGLGELDDEEQALVETYGLAPDQLYWRRLTIRNKCGGDVDLFRQEYPASPEEAFLVSGRPFFDRAALQAHMRRTRPGDRGYLVETDGRVQFVPDTQGWLEVWRHPEEGRRYAIGSDVAEGLEHGDYSCAQVIDRETMAQVAEWHGHIDPDLLAIEVVRLARWYNSAWLGVEANNHGLTTNKAIARLRYHRLMRRHMHLDEPDRNVEETERLGWLTDARTRPVMLDDLAQVIREHRIRLNGRGIVSECMTFARNERGKPEAQAGCHDDRVMAMAIAVQVHQLCPLGRPKGEVPDILPTDPYTGY